MHKALERLDYSAAKPHAVVYYEWKKEAPKDVTGRLLDWDHILHHVSMEQKPEIGDLIIEYHLDLFSDGDHQVEILDEVLRFKQIAYSQTIGIGHLDLNSLRLRVAQGKIPADHYNNLLRDIGYSLAGYWDARIDPFEQ